MARAAEISESQLRKDFVIATGLSPTEYLKRLRMAAARDLLLTTTRPVKDIADFVGLPDVSHFVRDFRVRYACAPSALRFAAGLAKAPGNSPESDSANK